MRLVLIDEPTLVLGYDLEKFWISSSGEIDKRHDISGLKAIYKVHKKFKAPFTIFVLGRMLEETDVVELLRVLLSEHSDLIDIEQHGYTHRPYKKLPNVKWPPLTPSEIRDDVAKAKELILKLFGRTCIGIRTPYGYYRGLQGEREVLNVLFSLGIRYISSDLRNQEESFPAPWEDPDGYLRQPYFYTDEGFPSLLEIPTQGWSDNYLYGLSKYVATEELPREEVFNIYASYLDYAIKKKLVFAPLFHPWVFGLKDPSAEVLNNLIEYAIAHDVTLMNYTQLYNFVIQKTSY